MAGSTTIIRGHLECWGDLKIIFTSKRTYRHAFCYKLTHVTFNTMHKMYTNLLLISLLWFAGIIPFLSIHTRYRACKLFIVLSILCITLNVVRPYNRFYFKLLCIVNVPIIIQRPTCGTLTTTFLDGFKLMVNPSQKPNDTFADSSIFYRVDPSRIKTQFLVGWIVNTTGSLL